MVHISISNAQILRIFLIVTLAFLIYNIIYTDNSSLNSKKRFRRPKFQRRPTKDSEMADQYLKMMASRRTIYQISRASTIPDSRVQHIVAECVKYSPSAFNMQASRAVILFREEHDKLWAMAHEAVKQNIGEEGHGKLKSRIDGYAGGYGTILFYEDNESVNPFKAHDPSFPFNDWTEHSSGMLQVNVWTALEQEGLGASLQHYNTFAGFEDRIRQEWDISPQWDLKAQMPFGKPGGAPREKTFKPLEGVRVISHGNNTTE